MATLRFIPKGPQSNNKLTLKQEYHKSKAEKYRKYLMISIWFNVLLISVLLFNNYH